MTTKKKPTASTTTYLIERGKEQLRVTVPSDWKVTCGPIVPTRSQNRNNSYGGYDAPHCIRFYEANDKQRAIFTGVTAFRDLSIPVEKMVQRVESGTYSKKTEKGELAESATAVEDAWIPL